MTDPPGRTATYPYDPGDRLTGIIHAPKSTQVPPTYTTTRPGQHG
jgi:YD repeat-containing protein